jgi:transketolase
MMSWSHFEDQTPEYQAQVLPPTVEKRISIEALTTMGWHRYVGFKGLTIGLDRFGESAKSEILFEKFGFTKDQIVEKIESYMK